MEKAIGIIKEVFLFRISTDERKSKIYGYFENKEVGRAVTRGKGWYGEHGWCDEKPIKVFVDHNGKAYKLEEVSISDAKSLEEAKREEALAKLTEEDKKVLGLC